LLVAASFWQLSLSSKLRQSGDLSDEIIKLDSSIVTEQRIAANFDKARDKLKDLEMKLGEAVSQLPDKSEIDDLLEGISDLARKSGLELNLFKRNEELFKDFYAEVPVAVAVTGAFHQVATFFDEVGRLSRIVNINQIQMYEAKPSDAGMVVKVECMLTAFRYLSEAERVERAPVDKKKRN
jgi:type IV pilus assembly protein PilO